MKPVFLLLGLYIVAAAIIHFGGPDAAYADDPTMSVAEEIRHERLSDLAAADMVGVWLEPAPGS